MRMLSWNIQWGRGADGRADLSRTVDTLRTMALPDVICLQEVAVNFPGLKGGGAGESVALLAAAFPGWSAHFAAGVDKPDGAGGRSLFGNLILSRLPVGLVLRHLLPQPPDPGLPSMPRVCLEAMVQAPFGWVRVLTTHLEYYSARQRRAQVEALRGIQREAAGLAAAGEAKGKVDASFSTGPRPASAILCGDLNCEPESPEFRALLA
ncbi:MAG: endonuclease, partial [Zoogloea sp.]|nr:endonuclease [Zoogloea sp.]